MVAEEDSLFWLTTEGIGRQKRTLNSKHAGSYGNISTYFENFVDLFRHCIKNRLFFFFFFLRYRREKKESVNMYSFEFFQWLARDNEQLALSWAQETFDFQVRGKKGNSADFLRNNDFPLIPSKSNQLFWKFFCGSMKLIHSVLVKVSDPNNCENISRL